MKVPKMLKGGENEDSPHLHPHPLSKKKKKNGRFVEQKKNVLFRAELTFQLFTN